MKRRAVFLDRDGVIAPDRVYVSASDFIPWPMALEALPLLKAAGYLTIVATNQAAVAKGLVSMLEVYRMHEKIPNIDRFYVCPHQDGDECQCRKPKPGMLVQAALDFGIDLGHSYMVGDRDVDVQAGNLAGCASLLVSGPTGLMEAARTILGLTSASWRRCG